MKQKQSAFWGYFLIAIGIVMLLANWFPVGMELMWPIFPLMVGGSSIYGYILNKKNIGLLMPGCILVIISFLFFYCNFAGWYHMETLWPIFLLAPSIGFAAMYVLGNQERGLLIPTVLLGGLSLIFMFISTGYGNWWPLIMILAGLFLIFQERKKNNEK